MKQRKHRIGLQCPICMDNLRNIFYTKEGGTGLDVVPMFHYCVACHKVFRTEAKEV